MIKPPKLLLTLLLLQLAMPVLAVSTPAPAGPAAVEQALSPEDQAAIETQHEFYDKRDIASCGGSAGGGAAVGLGGTLDGHTLPAASGGTGDEDAINEQGGLLKKPSELVKYHGNAAKGQAYRDYYITMRWRTNRWNWNGDAVGGPEDDAFYANAPRVLVTNPRTGKSIIAVVLEAGPAPWTGVDGGKNNNPKQGWINPQDGTPPGYKGRVSGFPPKAREALGSTQRMADGSGDDLLYSWAQDQNANPGPTSDSNSGGGSSGGGGGCSGGGLGISPEGFVFPLKTTKSVIKSQPASARWCYYQTNNCHHDYNAADIFAPTGTEIVAARGGTVVGVGSSPARLRIHDEVGKLWYYYTHMQAGSVTVKEHEVVKAGQVIGKIGNSADAEGTDPHLHYDISPVENGFKRPGPEAAVLIDPQPVLIEAFKALPE